MASKIYVGNLNYDVTDAELTDLFSQIGKVVSAVVITDRHSGRSKGFGFVEMSSDEEAKKAIETLNGNEFKERKMIVNEARPQKPRSF